MLKRFLLSGAALFSLAGAAVAGEAQSIGVNLTGGGDFLISPPQTKTYQFDLATAETYYTNSFHAVRGSSCFNDEGGQLQYFPAEPVAATACKLF